MKTETLSGSIGRFDATAAVPQQVATAGEIGRVWAAEMLRNAVTNTSSSEETRGTIHFTHA